MYLVKIDYEFPYEPYGRLEMMKCNGLYIVCSENQYKSIEKTKFFILSKYAEAIFIEVTSKLIDSGEQHLFIDGIIL